MEIAYEMLILIACLTSDDSNQRVELHILGLVHTEYWKVWKSDKNKTAKPA